MQHILPALVSIIGGAFTLAFVTKLLADVVQPNSEKNTWKNAVLTVFGMALVGAALLLAQRFSVFGGLSGAVQTVLAAVAVFGTLSVIVTRLFDMHIDDVLAAAPAIGTTTGAIGAMLFFAVGA